MGIQRTLALVKPDVCGKKHVEVTVETDDEGNQTETREVSEENVDDLVLARLAAEGFTVVQKKYLKMPKAMAMAFYAEHESREFYPALTDFMSSGPILALELEAEDAIAKWRALIGPTNSETARKASHEASPEDKSTWTLRALYGTDGRRNACHGSDSKYSASREINFFFPTAPKLERTLAMIKPDAVKAGAAEAIIKEVEAAGFTVLGQVEKTLTEDDAKTFYAEHVGKDFFPHLQNFMTSGPTVALALERMDAIRSWRMMMGPTSTADAKDKAPASIRARFGTDHTMNASHGSDSMESAARELGFWFPEPFPIERTLALVKPGLNEREEAGIRSMIAENGFTILSEERLQLTRERAGAFYAEHKGRPFYNSLVSYMTSGPIVAMVLSKPGAIKAWRNLLGPTKYSANRKAAGTIRNKYAKNDTENACHGSDSPVSAARELRFYFPALKLAEPSSFASPADAGEAAKTYLSGATAGDELTFLQVLQKGLVELCRSKPTPANSAIRSLGEWLLENNPRRLAEAKAEEARRQQEAQLAALESKQKEEEDRLKDLPNQGRVVPQDGARKKRVVFAAPGVTEAVVQRISDKFGYTVLAAPQAADGSVATFKEVYADLKMRMNKAGNHKFVITGIKSEEEAFAVEKGLGTEIAFMLAPADGAGAGSYADVGRARLYSSDEEVDAIFRPKVFFVLGGPGSGKGTQCSLLCKEFGYDYISTGDLLREKCASGTPEGNDLARIIRNGQLVRDEVVMDLIQFHINKSANNKFLLDGFPRNKKQADLFEEIFGTPQFALHLDCADETMRTRMQKFHDVEEKIDDSITSVKLRIKAFHENTEPLLASLDARGLTRIVTAEAEAAKVYRAVRQHFLPKIAFVIGSAESATEEKRAAVAAATGYARINMKQVRRCEIARETAEGTEIKRMIEAKMMVPATHDCALLKKAIDAADSSSFMLESFPKYLDQAETFEKTAYDCSCAIHFGDVGDLAAMERINLLMPYHYARCGRLVVSDGEGDVFDRTGESEGPENTIVLLESMPSKDKARNSNVIDQICVGAKCAYVNVADKLLEEAASGSADGKAIASLMFRGATVPLALQLKVVKEFMDTCPVNKFVIEGLPSAELIANGYPLAHDQIEAISNTLGKVTQVVQVTINRDEFDGEDKEFFAFKSSPTAAYAAAAGMLSTVEDAASSTSEGAEGQLLQLVKLVATKLSPAAIAEEKAAARAKMVQERAEEKAREEAEEGYGEEGEAAEGEEKGGEEEEKE